MVLSEGVHGDMVAQTVHDCGCELGVVECPW